MTLTKQDLVGIKEALQPEFDKLDTRITKVDTKVSKLDNKVTTLDTKVSKLDNKVTTLDSKVGKIDKKLSKLSRDNRKDHNMIIESFDEADHKHAKRISRIEDHINFPTLQ